MKACSKCGESKPYSEFSKGTRYADGYQSYCKVCTRAYQKKWGTDHQEQRRDYERRWHLANKERHNRTTRQRCRVRWRDDPEYRERKNRQKKEQIQRKYQTDPAWVEKRRRWGRTSRLRRRVRLLLAPGSHTPDEWEQLCQKYDYRCLRCGERKPLTLDHVIPLSLGGSDFIDNIQPLCGSCNSQKHTQITDYRPW